MTVTAVFADVEALLVGYLAATFPGVSFAVEIPSNLADVLPFGRVERIGGGSIGRASDGATVDVDCFNTTRLITNDFAYQVWTALTQLGGYSALGATVSDVLVHNFGWRPYSNTNVRSVGMSVDLTLHNHT